MIALLRHYTLFLIFILGSISLCPAQDYRQDMEKFYEAFGNADKMHMEVRVDVFKDKTGKDLMLKKKYIIRKSGNNYAYSGDDMSMLMNEKCIIVLSENDKSMVYSKRDKKNEIDFSKYTFSKEQLDSIFKQNDSVVYVGLSNGLKHYNIYSNKGLIQRTEVYLDAKNNFISRLVYYYNESAYPMGSRVEISYKGLNFSPNFTGNEFSEKQFVTIAGNKVTASEKYKGFRITIPQ